MKKLLWIIGSVSLIAPTVIPTIDQFIYQPLLIQERFTNKYHVQIPVAGMMNDIQGGFFRDGKWHVYFLYNDELRVNKYGKRFGDKSTSFYHLTTTDWIHWEYVGIAIPKNLTKYKDVSSGTFFEDKNNLFGYDKDGKAIIVMATSYANDQQNVLGYYSIDGGYNFLPIKNTPIISITQKPGNDKNMRDPYFFVRKKDEQWEYVMYNAENTEFGVWVSNSPTSGYQRVGAVIPKHPMLECPNLYQLNVENSEEQKWVLLYGGNGGWGPDADDLSTGTYYSVGEINENNVFVPDENQTTKRLDFGPDFYAAKFMNPSWENTNLDYLITTGWVGNWNYNYVTPHDGRIGKMSLARKIVLTKDEDDQFVFKNSVLGFENISKTTTSFSKLKSLDLNGGALKLNLSLEDMKNFSGILKTTFQDGHYLLTMEFDFKNNQVIFKRTSNDKIVSKRKDYGKQRIFSSDLVVDNKTQIEFYLDKTLLEVKLPDQKMITITKILGVSTQETISFSSDLEFSGSYDLYDLNNFQSRLN